MEKLIVDRIVGDIAVLEKEDKSHIEISLAEISFEIKEGSVLLFDGFGYSADVESEDERRNRIFQLQERLRSKG